MAAELAASETAAMHKPVESATPLDLDQRHCSVTAALVQLGGSL